MSVERWLAVVGFETTHEVSSLGRVRVIVASQYRPAGRVLTLSRDSAGYMKAALWRGGKVKHRSVHRLVVEAFIGPAPPDAMQAAHRDGDRTNNRLDNLRWASASENAQDKKVHGKVWTRPVKTGRKRCALNGRQVNAIRRRRRAGERVCDLASAYGVHRSTIIRAAYGRTYEGRASVAAATPTRRGA